MMAKSAQREQKAFPRLRANKKWVINKSEFATKRAVSGVALFLYKNVEITTQSSTPSTQQAANYVNSEARNTMKIVKES